MNDGNAVYLGWRVYPTNPYCACQLVGLGVLGISRRVRLKMSVPCICHRINLYGTTGEHSSSRAWLAPRHPETLQANTDHGPWTTRPQPLHW